MCPRECFHRGEIHGHGKSASPFTVRERDMYKRENEDRVSFQQIGHFGIVLPLEQLVAEFIAHAVPVQVLTDGMQPFEFLLKLNDGLFSVGDQFFQVFVAKFLAVSALPGAFTAFLQPRIRIAFHRFSTTFTHLKGKITNAPCDPLEI